jgi:hypothetical protein
MDKTMDNATLLTLQLTDIFRIGLMAGLVYTTLRNRAHTGLVIPLLAGVAFIAVIIASTMPIPNVAMVQAITTGIVANAIILAAVWTILELIKKFQK